MATKDNEKITHEQIKDALIRSGYFLESRVLHILHKRNYRNAPNITYPDSGTGKSREIDIYSESQRVTENLNLNYHLHFEFQHRLIIECSNNPQPAIFFKRPDRSKETIFGKFGYSKLERDVLEGESAHTADYIFHHYT